MTDEDVSELAECLAYVCDEAIRRGNKVAPVQRSFLPDGSDDWSCNCPIGYLLSTSYPPSVDCPEFRSFIAGFDGTPFDRASHSDLRLFCLGRQFLERYDQPAA